MSDSVEVTGRCLCGAVRISARVDTAAVDACHCDMCRRWAGAPMMAVEAGGAVKFEGDEHVAVYISSQWAERGFCRECGTHLFFRLRDQPHYSFPVGLLDEGPPWYFEKEIFVEEKPDFYDFANDTRRLTGQEAIDEFSNS